uniref:Ubiquitin-like protease family profile domain-containing protein n=1 Tax=Amphimedon queenslandica TaxID=400682 RepID=A0A1X7V1H9_AMPQE
MADQFQELEDDEITIESCIRGHHVSEPFWTPTIGEVLSCEREEDNVFDPYAVAMLKTVNTRLVVGHVSRSSISCIVSDNRRHSSDLPQGGLEVPCKLTFKGGEKHVTKIKKLFGIASAPTSDLFEPSPKRMKKDDFSDDNRIVIPDGDDDSNTREIWIALDKRHQLSLSDKDYIESGDWIPNKVIVFAQVLLKRQFQHLQGLVSPLVLSKPDTMLPFHNALQIVHDRGNHWIVVSTSMNCQETRELFGQEARLKLMVCPQQKGGMDCGVFAIAVCTSLAHRQPLPLSFKQDSKRAHLLKCFEDLQLTPFP